MHKRPSYWPADRSLFRDKARRRSAAVWAVLIGAVIAALIVAAVWRQPVI
jgi:hypothetical protein